MSYNNNYAEQLNNILLINGISINIPEHKFKKFSTIFNEALREVYNNNKEKEVKMYYILLSISEYFDLEWLKGNILDESNFSLIETEMIEDFNVKTKKKKNAKK